MKAAEAEPTRKGWKHIELHMKTRPDWELFVVCYSHHTKLKHLASGDQHLLSPDEAVLRIRG